MNKAPQKLAHSLKDYADVVGVSVGTLRNDIRAGRLKARKIGRRTIITEEDGRAYLDSLPALTPRQEPSAPKSFR